MILSKNFIEVLYEAAHIQRWNDHIRPQGFTELDKQAHKMVILYVLSRYEEQDHGAKLNWQVLVEGGIFEFLHRIILTDIKPPVFHELMRVHGDKLNNWVYNELERKVPDIDQDFLGRMKNYFDKDSKGNTLGKGFDDSPKRQMDFSTLITNSSISIDQSVTKHFMKGSFAYLMPTDTFIILNESINGTNNVYTVIPVSYSEYGRLMSKPYKFPPKSQAWRLITDKQTSGGIAEILGVFDTATPTYEVRYIRQPNPIILANFSTIQEGLTIDGASTVSDCELSPEIHQEILQRAVELAKIAWGGDQNNINTTVQSGQRSE